MKKEKIDINNYCKTAGIILILLGIIHILLSGVLSAIWGYLLIIVGIVSLFHRTKVIILVIGIMLVLVGLLNISDSIFYEIKAFWLIFGGFQIYLGITEIKRYRKVKENPKYSKKDNWFKKTFSPDVRK